MDIPAVVDILVVVDTPLAAGEDNVDLQDIPFRGHIRPRIGLDPSKTAAQELVDNVVHHSSVAAAAADIVDILGHLLRSNPARSLATGDTVGVVRHTAAEDNLDYSPDLRRTGRTGRTGLGHHTVAVGCTDPRSYLDVDIETSCRKRIERFKWEQVKKDKQSKR